MFSLFNSISSNLLIEFSLTSTKLGILSSGYLLSNALWLIPGGILLDHYPIKRMVLIFMAIAVLSCYIMAYSSSFLLCLLARMLQGLASAMSLLTITRLACVLFPMSRARAMGIGIAFALCGGIFSNIGFLPIVNYLGWRNAMVSAGMIGLTFFLVILVFFNGNAVNLTSQKAQLGTITGKFLLARVGVYVGLMNLPNFVLSSLWGNVFLMQVHTLTNVAASAVITFLFLGTMVGLPTMGFIVDTFHNRKLTMLFGSILALIVLLEIILIRNQSFHSLCFAFFLLGFFSSSQLVGFSIIANRYALSCLSRVTSIVALIESLIGMLAQPLFGFMLNCRWQSCVQTISVSSKEDYLFASMLLIAGFIVCIVLTICIPVKVGAYDNN